MGLWLNDFFSFQPFQTCAFNPDPLVVPFSLTHSHKNTITLTHTKHTITLTHTKHTITHAHNTRTNTLTNTQTPPRTPSLGTLFHVGRNCAGWRSVFRFLGKTFHFRYILVQHLVTDGDCTGISVLMGEFERVGLYCTCDLCAIVWVCMRV